MIRLCIATQTPPTRPIGAQRPAPSTEWRLGRDYIPNVGGVVPMMRALLRTAQGRWVTPHSRWVALGSSGLPEEFETDEGYVVETVPLEPEVRAGYLRFKDAVWRSFHGPWGLEPFASDDYRAYVDYNHRTAQRLLRQRGTYDVFYVNDFQLLLVGGLVGAAAPAILRWHIPLELQGYPEPVRRFFLRAMEDFDAIVVSTRRRPRGVDPLRVPRPRLPGLSVHRPGRACDGPRRGRSDLPRPARARGPALPVVGRSDGPRQAPGPLVDGVRAGAPTISGLPAGARRGGSFSTGLSEGQGGPSKAEAWARRVQGIVRTERLEGSVVLAGELSEEELRAAYGGATALVHPAPWEGFGLVAVAAWTHGLPVVVSRGAGVSELVTDGLNGFSVPPGSASSLAARMVELLVHPDRTERMGEAGRLIARRCHVRPAARQVREIFQHAIRVYRVRGRSPPPILYG